MIRQGDLPKDGDLTWQGSGIVGSTCDGGGSGDWVDMVIGQLIWLGHNRMFGETR